MKIVHLPIEIAGQNNLSVVGLNLIHQSAKSIYQKHPFQYASQPDWEFSLSNKFANAKLAARIAGKFDVYHYHYAQTLLPTTMFFMDAMVNKIVKKKVVVEFWGSDIRKPSVESIRNPYYFNSYAESDQKSSFRSFLWSKITSGHVIMSDHSLNYALEPYFSHIHIVRQRFDVLQVAPSFPDSMVKIPRIVHIPSQLAFKGTEFIRLAVEKLKEKKLKFEYLELSGVSHQEVMAACASADLIIDQVRGGSHGVFAVEAMAMGKPVICYILPEILPTYAEGFPIINANPDTLECVLEEWIQNPQARFECGKQSREYAERVHDIRVVARRLLDVYEQLP